MLTLADRMRPHSLLALSASGAAVRTLLCTVADGAAIALRGLTGMFLAGVYPGGDEADGVVVAPGPPGP